MEKTTEKQPQNGQKTGTTHPPGIKLGPIPRVLTKQAIRAYFDLNRRSFKKLVNHRIIIAMGIEPTEHWKIKEYDSDQTRVLIEELQLTDEELRAMSVYM